MSKVVIKGYVVGAIQTNVWVLHLENSSKAIVVDPADYGDRIAELLDKEGLEVVGILLTHAHFDHIGGVSSLKEKTGAAVYIWEGERHLCGDAEDNLSASYNRPTTVIPDCFWKDNDTLELAGMSIKGIATPGHTEGSCCYFIDRSEDVGDAPVLISGDTLFEESVGRTDLPTGSMSTLIRSVRDKLLVLPKDTIVYPGHGGTTSIGYEMEHNFYIQ